MSSRGSYNTEPDEPGWSLTHTRSQGPLIVANDSAVDPP